MSFRLRLPAPGYRCRISTVRLLRIQERIQARDAERPAMRSFELDLSIIEFEDGSGTPSMHMRNTAIASPDTIDISHAGGWPPHRAKNGIRFEGSRV